MEKIKINNIDFFIENKYYQGFTQLNKYWLNTTVLSPDENDNNIIKLDIDKVLSVIDKNKIEKLQNIHAITINWDNVDLSELGEEFSQISNTGQLMSAIIKASKMGGDVKIIIDKILSIASENPISNKAVASEFNSLDNSIIDLAECAQQELDAINELDK